MDWHEFGFMLDEHFLNHLDGVGDVRIGVRRRHITGPIRHQVNAFRNQRYEKQIAGFLIAIQRVAIIAHLVAGGERHMIAGTDAH
jgi:hypothetical protein